LVAARHQEKLRIYRDRWKKASNNGPNPDSRNFSGVRYQSRCYDGNKEGYSEVSDTMYLKDTSHELMGTSHKLKVVLETMGSQSQLGDSIGCWFLFDLITAGPNDEQCIEYPWIDNQGSTPRVIVPANFIDHPAVGTELLAFMLYHEIGHALGEGDRCERDADQWAITCGMASYFPDDPIAALNKAAEQLDAYSRALRTNDSFARSSNGTACVGTTGCENCYPRLECRLADIRDGIVDWSIDPARMASQCWDMINAEGPIAKCGTPCTTPCEQSNTGYVELTTIHERLRDELQLLGAELRTATCGASWRPCLLDKAKIIDQLREKVPRFKHRSNKLENSMEKALQNVQELRSALGAAPKRAK